MFKEIALFTVGVLFLLVITPLCYGYEDETAGEIDDGARAYNAADMETDDGARVYKAVTVETDDVAAETESDTKTEETPVCPKCGSGNVIPIIYGKPSQELVEIAESGEVKLGGCVLDRESPFWYCKDCGAEW